MNAFFLKKFIFFLLCLSCIPPEGQLIAVASPPPQPENVSTEECRRVYSCIIDSLLNLIENSTDPERLNIYPRLHKALYEVDDIEVHLAYNNDFLTAARAAKDKKAEAIAHVLRLETLYNYGSADSLLLAESWKALDFMRGVAGAEVHYFYTAAMIGDVYLLQGNFHESLEIARRFYEEAKTTRNSSGIVASLQTMGKAYKELGLKDKAEISFRESIELADERSDAGMKGEAYSNLVDMLNDTGRHEEALETNREFQAYLDRINAWNGELKNLYFLNYMSYATCYTRLGQTDMACDYISRAAEFPVSTTTLGIYAIENARFPLLLEGERYMEAEQSLDRIAGILEDKGTSYHIALLENKRLRAELYLRWGRNHQAAVNYKEYISLKDSLQRVEIADRLNNLRSLYELDKVEMQREQDKRTFHIKLTLLGTLLLLLSVTIAVVVWNWRSLRSKNHSLLEQFKEQDKLENDNELLREELARRESVEVPESGEQTDRLGEIYILLKELMKDPAVYTDPEINRKNIAEKLGTNEKYIFDTIRRYHDTSIQDYITNLRLNYARNLLADPTGRRTIEAIALEAGFNSRSTFHRLFRERYGMSPNEFRKVVTGL